MNGISVNTKIVEVTPWWQTALTVLDITLGVLTAASAAMLVTAIRQKKKSSNAIAVEKKGE